MKVISIVGSPKGIEGYTGLLVTGILEAVKSAGAETQLFTLKDLLVLPCKGCQHICNVEGEDADEKSQLMESAKALGSRMVEAIRNRERFPEQEDERNQAFEIMKFMVMTLQEEWPFVWDYWNKHWDFAQEDT